MQCVSDNVLQGQSWDYIKTVLGFTKILTVLQRWEKKKRRHSAVLEEERKYIILVSHWFIFPKTIDFNRGVRRKGEQWKADRYYRLVCYSFSP